MSVLFPRTFQFFFFKSVRIVFTVRPHFFETNFVEFFLQCSDFSLALKCSINERSLLLRQPQSQPYPKTSEPSTKHFDLIFKNL
jgi:hypothetical protein